MAKHIDIKPFKLTKQQKKLLTDFLTGSATLRDTAKALGVTSMRVYIMCTALTRHASTTGGININEVLKSY